MESMLKKRGSALVESILVVGVLTTFMIGIPMLGSLVDLKQTTIQASRYSAWEKTVNVNPEYVGDQIDERFFRSATAPISSTPNSNLAANHLWGELSQSTDTQAGLNSSASGTVPSDGTMPSLAQRARVTLAGSTVDKNSGGHSPSGGDAFGTVTDVVVGLGKTISSAGWNDADHNGHGLVRSTITAHIDTNDIFTSSLSLNESTSIFIDGWAAGDDNKIRDRVQGFVPTNMLSGVRGFIKVIKYIPMLGDLENLEDAFGCVKNNIVPPKELGPVSDEPGLTTYDESAGDNC